MRRAVFLCAGVLVLVVALAGCDAGAFQIRTGALERSWQTWEAAGVPAASLAPARERLTQVQAERSGPIPYSVISAALVEDPLADVEKMGERAHSDAVTAARGRAETALAALQKIGGTNYETAYEDHVVELARGREPIDFDRLGAAWRHEATVLQGLQNDLSNASGGLSGGLPRDVVEGSVHLSSLATSLEAAGLPTGSGWQAVAGAQMYLRQGYAPMLQQHGAVQKELQAALSELQGRMDQWNGARQALSQAEGLLPRLESLGAGKDFQGRLDQVRQSLGAVHDDAALAQGAQAARKLLSDMQAAQQGSLPVQTVTTAIPCIPGAPQDLIVIHLATQQLVAYNSGCPWLRTPVTTGRPALPTDRGTFQIFGKYPAFHMVSQWPKTSPFYYPPTWVYNAMEFVSDGTFIHNANWEPPSAYGPGSQYGPYSSHGCVHVMDGPLQQLYSWAPIGTTVQVGD
jgi:lipoprotein-anchoring transpeptidase ErfK/SrfK